MIDDYDLIVASFQTQYGIRLPTELSNMAWSEFEMLLKGLDSSTPLGKIISIRAEKDQETLSHFTPYQKKIHSDWAKRLAANKTQQQHDEFLHSLQEAFESLAR